MFADEIAFLDITAAQESRTISLDFVKQVGEEANMPFAVGGGISKISDIQSLINGGAEKVIIGSSSIKDPEFIRQASDYFGSSTITVCIDYKKHLFKNNRIFFLNGTKQTKYSPIDFAKMMEDKGAGELILQSIDNDGRKQGYDYELLKEISTAVKIPIIGLGGAGNLSHLEKAYKYSNCSGLAAGSLFIFHGARDGVLINYPTKEQIKNLFI